MENTSKSFLESANVRMIKEIVCEEMNITMELVHTKCRKKHIVMARQVIMFFMYRLVPGISLQGIADSFGLGYDHATVIYSKKTVVNLCAYPEYKAMIDLIEAKLSNINMNKFTFEREMIRFQTAIKRAGTQIDGITELPTPIALRTMAAVKVSMNKLAKEIKSKIKILKNEAKAE